MITIKVTDISFKEEWSRAHKSLVTPLPIYTASALSYYEEYFSSSGMIHNASFIVKKDTEYLAIVPLYIFKNSRTGYNQISFGQNEYIKAPFFTHQSTKQLSKTSQFISEQISQIIEKFDIRNIYFAHDPSSYLIDKYFFPFFQAASSSNYIIEANVIDLRSGLEHLWFNLRKSYKPLINKTKKSFSVSIIDYKTYSYDECQKYKFLHNKAAGRETRPQKTFDLMYEMIRSDDAYLIIISKNEEVLGTYFFFKSSLIALYASSATDPSVSNTDGVGHLGLWSGVEYAYNRGLSLVDMAMCPPSISNTSIEKKVSAINFFKRGFSGVTCALICNKFEYNSSEQLREKFLAKL
ncbi:hypothetical protein [Bacteriovorax sp. Seq25_V]|uniref:hypothetical protein n=1 Tax=Bacteriovorax sp. Seq25_V TaxID=1201288 RepID=UPI000389DEB4|nr:hypothetical protein [Bacteriovorax sp. Seq25_V]EQC43208.1 hypothetical protein M900_0057 [Bacteriovorax sp. Seq25_V]